MITVRKFKDDDGLEASDLIRKVLLELNSRDYPESVIQFLYNEFSPESIIKLSKDRLFLVAEEKGKIIGTITFTDNYIATVFVNPKEHGRGIGKKLMYTVEDIARKRKLKWIKLDASITAVEFYKKLGYSMEEKRDDKDYGITYIMTKKL